MSIMMAIIIVDEKLRQLTFRINSDGRTVRSQDLIIDRADIEREAIERRNAEADAILDQPDVQAAMKAFIAKKEAKLVAEAVVRVLRELADEVAGLHDDYNKTGESGWIGRSDVIGLIAAKAEVEGMTL